MGSVGARSLVLEVKSLGEPTLRSDSSRTACILQTKDRLVSGRCPFGQGAAVAWV
jgi:hypothetical protein